MLTNQQMEDMWWKYKSEGIANNLSLQAFCSIHSIPYNQFEKFLKLRKNLSEVHPVKVTAIPHPEPSVKEPVTQANEESSAQSQSKNSPTRIIVSIRMSNGTQVSKKNLDYRGMLSLVEKQEVHSAMQSLS